MDDTNYYGSVDENEFRFGVRKGETFFALSNFVADIILEVNSETGNLSGHVFQINWWTSIGVSNAYMYMYIR